MAVHSATIAGLEDIVRIILEADNMKDLNTPTLHTNETLAHLAAKHGHQSLYDLLDRFGADLSVRNSNGELVYDVTTDQEWRREIVANIVKKKKKLAFGEESHRNSMLQYKGHLPVEVEQLRKSVLAQQDEECRSALAKAETKTKLLKKAISASTAPPLSSTSDAASSKLSGQMKQVLLSPTPETEEKPTENLSKRIADLHRWFDTATTFIARQSSEDTVTGFNADDVESARAMIIELESIVRFLSHPTRLNSTYPWARVFVATNAFKIIHMMQKLHRVTQPANTAPLLGPVKELCDTTLDFTEFVVGTAQLLASFSRNSQAREILDVLEKRLLKTPFDKRKPTEFRALVQMYSTARDTMGMGSTSSPKTSRALEWYLTNTVGNAELQEKLDGMIGHPVYFDLTPTAETTTQQFDEFKSALVSIPELRRVICLSREGKRVMYGGSNKMDVKRVRGSVMATAEGVGVRFDGEGSQDFTSAVSVGEFVISIGGASRNAVAA
ncbi:hypothetical protein PR003_g25528 [Phytophthora rubi]|uniref:Uncharacterized protein n=1 Tax=Phytophthora rubi TaxID=129364 RepID=A0A6A3IBF1_9STRA|nr:hypothetical protein PR002_g24599 [Phytophthora rubi]KAE8980604.1 hypothetical protein PR001_g24236 [Phytophthora rubi]KAE9289540.1 hypothetical protein PR003_g25528 [Phytophthora rubi]